MVTRAYIDGFRKAAEDAGVDPDMLMKQALSWSSIVNAGRRAASSAGGGLRRFGQLLGGGNKRIYAAKDRAMRAVNASKDVLHSRIMQDSQLGTKIMEANSAVTEHGNQVAKSLQRAARARSHMDQANALVGEREDAFRWLLAQQGQLDSRLAGMRGPNASLFQKLKNILPGSAYRKLMAKSDEFGRAVDRARDAGMSANARATRYSGVMRGAEADARVAREQMAHARRAADRFATQRRDLQTQLESARRDLTRRQGRFDMASAAADTERNKVLAARIGTGVGTLGLGAGIYGLASGDNRNVG